MSLPNLQAVEDPTPEALFFPGDDPEPARDTSSEKLCAEPGCSNVVALTPTGRKGKYCEVHKASHTKGATSKPRQNRTGWAKAPEVENALNQFTNFLAMGLSALGTASENEQLLTDALILTNGMPKVNHELVELAKVDKTFQKYLDWLSSPGKYGALTIASLGVIVPLLANHGMIPFLPSLTGDGSTTDNEGRNGQ